MWPEQRAQELMEKTRRFHGRERLRVCFVPSPVTSAFKYFPDGLQDYLATAIDPGRIDIVEPPGAADIYIFPAHGSNLSNGLWNIKKTAPDALFAIWFWDNHMAELNNLSTALAADFLFPSHAFCADYLGNPVSVLGRHVPACCAQWTPGDADSLFREFIHELRSNQLLVNYVDYPFSWRHEVLHDLKNNMHEADVFIMPEGDRSRYFDKSRQQRMQEWCSYKIALVLPVSKDLSTRVFDGLTAGMVLLIPDIVADLDKVIPPDMQTELGIVRFEYRSTETVRVAHEMAIRVFDEQGESGVRRRHDYVLKEHMLANRINSIVDEIDSVITGAREIGFSGDNGQPFGLRLRPGN